jgi:thiol:disulfide interchange protein DsbD
VIPINVAYIGGQSSGSKLKGFVLSLFYVLGMALAYTFLGCFAALTGRLFGQIQTNPWTYFIVGNVCIILGLSMFDIFSLPLPRFLNRFQPKEKKKGLLGSFVVGIASGFVLGPCTAPILAVLLSYVATKQNIFFGMSLLFVFAFGMGTLLIILGSFAGFLTNLPKAGMWMIRIKKIFGWILIGIGEYFLITAGKFWI